MRSIQFKMSHKTATQKKRIILRIQVEEQFQEKIKEAAKAQGLTISSLTRFLLHQHINKNKVV